MELKPGVQFASRYLVEHVIDDDDDGTLLATREGQNGLLVAVKVFPSTASEEHIISRFRRAQKIESPHVPKLFELGGLDDGRTFVAMEYLSGTTMAERVARGSLAVGEVLDAVRHACLAVAAAHRAGVVHRRLDTSKLFLAKAANGRPQLRVLGFATGAHLAAPKPGELPVKVEYLAPEQLNGIKNAERSSDIWALGVILYELLTGRRPFTGMTRKAVAKQIASEDPKPPRSIRPDLPWELEQIVLRCLDKAPSSRIQSAEALAEALQAFAVSNAPLSIEPTMLSAADARDASNIESKTPPSLPQVAKLNHVLSGAPSGASTEQTPPGFHRIRDDGQIEKLRVDQVVDIARAKRAADATSKLEAATRQRTGETVPPLSRDGRTSLAPPAARSIQPPPNPSWLTTRNMIGLLLLAAVVLGLTAGLIVRAIIP